MLVLHIVPVVASLLATCADVMKTTACIGLDCGACGDRIEALEASGHRRAVAENMVGQNYTDCAVCVNTRDSFDFDEQVPDGCKTAWSTQACDAAAGGVCDLCGNRIEALLSAAGGSFSLSAARHKIAVDFPQACGACLLAAVTPPFSAYSVPHPIRFEPFMRLNVDNVTSLPRSYQVHPADFFDTVPIHLRTNVATQPAFVDVCSAEVSADRLNDYTFETEKNLVSYGVDVYDAGAWSIALAALGTELPVTAYTHDTIFLSKTAGLDSIRADAECLGSIADGQCSSASGACGFCYGDEMLSLDANSSLLYRLISPFYAVPNTVDPRCPELDLRWTWNEFKPVMGENAWAIFLGPLTSALKKYGSADNVPLDCTEMTVALNFVPALDAMRVPITDPSVVGYGGFYYTAHNAVGGGDIGTVVSVENQASLLAGLRLLIHVLGGRDVMVDLRCKLEEYALGVETFLLASWKIDHFQDSGRYDRTSNVFTFEDHDFASDCQTWVASVLGTPLIDGAFGPKAALRLWTKLKGATGYGKYTDGRVKGLGFTLPGTEFQYSSAVYGSGDKDVFTGTLRVVLTRDDASFDEPRFKSALVTLIDDPAAADAIIVTGHEPSGSGTTMYAYVAFATDSSAVSSSVTVRMLYDKVQGYASAVTQACNTEGHAGAGVVGCTRATYVQVVTPEWTLGAINWARVMANDSGYAASEVQALMDDADFMRESLENELLIESFVGLDSRVKHASFPYSSARYFVTFGWWANPMPSLASTAWAAAVDLGWNPLHGHGWYSAEYPRSVSPCATAQPPSQAPPTDAPPDSGRRYIAFGVSGVTLQTMLTNMEALTDGILLYTGFDTDELACLSLCEHRFMVSAWVPNACVACDGSEYIEEIPPNDAPEDEVVEATNRHVEVQSEAVKYVIMYLSKPTDMTPKQITDALQTNGVRIMVITGGAFEGVSVTLSTPSPTPSPATDSPPTKRPVVSPETKTPETVEAAACIFSSSAQIVMLLCALLFLVL
ncbi:hypothetical protein DIPPA_18450 [Diplonema papillatum]|nr:hypothetical protein DIPPA_18450 [Diplonema papillatum]